jgi:hypothetical protein
MAKTKNIQAVDEAEFSGITVKWRSAITITVYRKSAGKTQAQRKLPV